MSKAFEAAEHAYWQASRAVENLDSERRREIRERMAVIEEEINAAYADRLQVARDERNKLHAAMEAVRYSENERHAWVGKPVSEWEHEGHSWQRLRKLVKTGIVGVVEIIGDTSQHSDGLSDYSTAKHGELVIRRLKKDGAPSKRYEKIKGDQLPWGWHFDDTDPNKPVDNS